jgi:hypothetical protein
MKNPFLHFIILVLFVSISIKIVAQEVVLPHNQETGLIEFTGLVKVDSSLTQQILYTKAKEWFANSFKSAKDVIQMDDKVAGIIVGKGNFSESKTCGIVNFTMKVQVKDGRYKYWVSNFKHEEHTRGWSGGNLENEKPDCGYYFMAKKVWLKFIPFAVDQHVNYMIQSLKVALSKGSIEKDKW